VQRQLDRLDLSLVRGAGFDESSLSYIRRELAKVVGDSLELRCHFVDEIPLTPSGKWRVCISELPATPAA
jgi:phenylacetate-CoA ligase